jgi:hypothetical protein
MANRLYSEPLARLFVEPAYMLSPYMLGRLCVEPAYVRPLM